MKSSAYVELARGLGGGGANCTESESTNVVGTPALGAHCAESRRCRAPLTDSESTPERRMRALKPSALRHASTAMPTSMPHGCALGQDSPPSPSSLSAAIECLAFVELGRSRRKQADERRVRGSNHRSAARRRREGFAIGVLAALDSVERVENRRMDGGEALTQGIRGVCDDERVDQDLVPLQDLVRSGVGRIYLSFCGIGGLGKAEQQRDAKDGPHLHKSLSGVSWVPPRRTMRFAEHCRNR